MKDEEIRDQCFFFFFFFFFFATTSKKIKCHVFSLNLFLAILLVSYMKKMKSHDFGVGGHIQASCQVWEGFFFFFPEVGRVGRDERGLRLYIIYLYDGYVAEI